MNSHYSIVDFAMLSPSYLSPHPAASVPMDDEDQSSLRRSIGETGCVHQPLLVDAEDGASVLDGCNRLIVARDLGLEKVPCLLVRCEDPRALALACLTSGRKRTTGQRVLVFVQQNWEAILAAKQKGREIAVGGKQNFTKTLKTPGESFDSPGAEKWSAEAISTLLKCSKKDVNLAIDLVECIERRTQIVEGPTDAAKPADSEYVAQLEEQRNILMAGSSGIRAWKRAFKGRHATRGRVKAETDYQTLALRAIKSLRNVAEHWPHIPFKAREHLVMRWREVVEILPDDLKMDDWGL